MGERLLGTTVGSPAGTRKEKSNTGTAVRTMGDAYTSCSSTFSFLVISTLEQQVPHSSCPQWRPFPVCLHQGGTHGTHQTYKPPPRSARLCSSLNSRCPGYPAS